MKNALKAAAMATLVIATLAGCFRVDLDLTLNADDTIDGTMVVAIQSGIGESFGESDAALLEEMTGGLEGELGDATVEDYAEDDYVGKAYAFKGLPLETFTSGGVGEELTITREDNVFIVDGTIDSGELDGGEDVDPASLGAEFTFSVTFPGEVTDHNGELSNDGRTVTWNLLDAPETLHAEGRAVASSNIWVWVLLGAVILLIGAGVVFAAVKARKDSAGTSDEAQEPPVAE